MGFSPGRFFERLRLAKSVWKRMELLDQQLRSADIQGGLDVHLSRHDVPKEIFDLFQSDRYTPEYAEVFAKDDPLVTICVATYNRGAILAERCVASLLAQSHRNIQVVVIGDCCVDDTPARMAAIKDSRLHFENLPERGVYPAHPDFRWMVAGTKPINRALELAEGDFVSHLDDDDFHDPRRVEKLLSLIREKRADIVWHPFLYEKPSGGWAENRAPKFAKNMVTTSSVLYHKWFRRIGWDPEAYRNHEPGDWNRFRKFLYLKAVAARHPEPLLKHHRERNQKAK